MNTQNKFPGQLGQPNSKINSSLKNLFLLHLFTRNYGKCIRDIYKAEFRTCFYSYYFKNVVVVRAADSQENPLQRHTCVFLCSVRSALHKVPVPDIFDWLLIIS